MSIKSDVKRATNALEAAVEEAVAESARAVRDEARQLVPQDTGTLHDHIVANVDGPSAKVGVFDDDTYYGQFVEFGTSKQRAQPFLGPAAEQERMKLEKRMINQAEKKL